MKAQEEKKCDIETETDIKVIYDTKRCRNIKRVIIDGRQLEVNNPTDMFELVRKRDRMLQ